MLHNEIINQTCYLSPVKPDHKTENKLMDPKCFRKQ